MGLYLAYTCDACGAKDEARPRNGMMPVVKPRGWYRLDGRDLCGLPCVARYAADPAEVPEAPWDPDPTLAMFRDLSKIQNKEGANRH